MQFSEQWLRTWVNPALQSDELAHLLTMAGLEVEETIPAAPPFSQVVVAEVKTVRPHENADRLRVTEVDVGQGELVQIVCGAPNVAPGVKVPCALPGATLPGDFKIKPTKMRGVESNGMLCSARELGISSDAGGLLILPADATVGMDMRDYLQLDDTLFVLKITPNRADCLSIKGVAREVAALTGQNWCPVVIREQTPQHDQTLPVSIQAKDACGRYIGRVIRGVNARVTTPEWMLRRLERSGLRSVSAVVDITNYVLLELGQPLHAFDLSKISGGIQVRMASRGETLQCLNERSVELDETMLVIADGQQPLALAGVMGGMSSSVTDATQDVFLESAYFAPQVIAGKSRLLGFGSDAAYRYERGVDPQLQREAIERATELLLLICGGSAGPLTEAVGNLPAARQVTLRTARVERLLGVALDSALIGQILTRLGLPHAETDGVFSVDVPSFRFDLAIEEDLIEEVARVYGYENIPVQAPRSWLRMLPQPENSRPAQSLSVIMAQRDYQEVVCYSFVEDRWEADFAGNDNPIRLINPIASQMNAMRTTLISSLVDALISNLNRKQPRVRLFELAKVYNRADTGFVQPLKLAGLAWGPRYAEQWAQKAERVDFYDVKADVEALIAPRIARFAPVQHPALHPGRAASVLVDGRQIGIVGELHPRWVQAYDLPNAPVVFELDAAALQESACVKAQAVSKFQSVRRDMALVVPQALTVDQLLDALQTAAPAVVTDIALFDLYQGPGVESGMKSLAFRILLQDESRTLTDEDVEPIMAALLQAAGALGALLRS